MEIVNAIGRRKSAVARVYLTEGTGKITINKKDLSVYFPSAILQYVVKQPLQLLEVAEKYDIIKSGKPFDIVYTVEENTYANNNIQLLVKDIKESENNSIASVLALLIKSKDDGDVVGSTGALINIHE